MKKGGRGAPNTFASPLKAIAFLLLLFFIFARQLGIESPQLPSWESRMGDERRRTPRYPFIATAEVVDQSTQASIATRVTELSLTACYFDMTNTVRSDTQIKITIDAQRKYLESTA